MLRMTFKRSKNITTFLLIIAGALAAVLAIELLTNAPAYINYKSDLPRSEHHELAPSHIDPSWIISGSPVFYGSAFENSLHWGTSSGFWECVGPAEFVWHYSVDETIYIVEGSAEIEYLGRKFTLRAGDSTRFVSGTTATWVVKDRIKKTFRIHNPGYLVKAMRRILELVT